MNSTLKTVLLTVLTLSVLTIAIIELTGVSTTAIFNPQQVEEHHFDRAESTDLALTEMTFKKNHYDFGTIKEGQKVSHSFEFVNSGQAPLKIERVIPSCGCTVPNYPQELILPGETGWIEFEFDSTNRVGENKRKITIIANVPSETEVVTFEAIVEKK